MKSTICQPDDFEVGGLYAVYGIKGQEEPIPCAGMALQLKAIQLPFVVGQLVAQPMHPPVTLDVRFFDFMKVDPAFAEAQKGVAVQQQLPPNHPLAVLFGQR